ncbi:hypothetical protein [Geobacillus stearothermophilus]|uniref:hypothetical protein n=1 Tax=Geobacillus stearothermophilus TaxID=1422 RepID=UPI002E1A4D63|nr:hypothetical protein [Geobacillus stearothermophilus]MED3741438.1 hypothetical protein [Geobacillus stearothermophilus]MED3767761.1 hypothetical protein [Geobacillus stearothermophilus]MED3775373.1 hypothetical protein [Geobacillus stearothermophilus]
MAKKLTAGVLNGTAYQETLTVTWNGEEFEVDIRPLNNKEALEIEELMQEGVSVKGTPTLKGKMTQTLQFDTKANLRGRKRAAIKAVAYGTVDPMITEQVVENEFPPKLVEGIAARIYELTGIGNKQQIQEAVENDEDSFPQS